jgi:hypothetical protein
MKKSLEAAMAKQRKSPISEGKFCIDAFPPHSGNSQLEQARCVWVNYAHGIMATFARILFWLMLAGALVFGSVAYGVEQQCTYSTYKWNVRDRKAVDQRKIVKPLSELTAAEIDSQTGCTVCEEDQVTLAFVGLRPFRVCKLVSLRVQAIIASLQRMQAPLLDVVGYRVGMTRGEIDSEGNRTGFSNHSFGVALDINTDQNGLYENCVSFDSSCRLVKGGSWNSNQQFSLTEESVIVQEFKKNNFHWGGEIIGQQKDFMHFSPSGY